jgi:hypothetical protein
MKAYMIEVPLPFSPSQEFFSLIPSQRLKIAELMNRRKILSYTVSSDRLHLWIVLAANDELEARQILAEQPMDKYFRYTFHELMFHEMAGLMFPSVSLN